MKFYICDTCGNLIQSIWESGAKIVCCGHQMRELIPGTTDGAAEKHVPVISRDGNKVIVSVGSIAHPMIPEHYIQWIVLETRKGSQRVELSPLDEPKAEFLLTEVDEVIAAYEYCNLHSLWKSN